jgi:Plasmid stabilisation system protein.
MSESLRYVLEFTPQAREDIREIVLWYRNEVEGLEERFLLNLEVSINSLIKNPFIYQINFETIRAVLISKFPYRLHYIVEGNSIKVLGVIHVKRSPKLIRRRIKK